jgi:hypothetical protein
MPHSPMPIVILVPPLPFLPPALGLPFDAGKPKEDNEGLRALLAARELVLCVRVCVCVCVCVCVYEMAGHST